MRRLVKIAAAAGAALMLAVGPAAAQVPDPFARELAQKLAEANTPLAEEGYARAAGPFSGGLREREQQRFTLMLRANQDFRIVGFCDSRCRGMDMRLEDSTGVEVARAIPQGGAAEMYVRPRVTGQHALDVTMERCAAEPCWFAFNVYTR